MPFLSKSSRRPAFTLVELLVSMAVLTLLILLVTQLLNIAIAITNTGNAHMDADAEARAVLDRMAVDLGAMVKRPDVDYFLKGMTTYAAPSDNNDQLAFYSEVPGYSSATPSSLSLVSYRLNPDTLKAERLGKGLIWNGVASSTQTPMVYLPIKLTDVWNDALTKTGADQDGDWELIGPQVFRLEYYYVLKAPAVTGTNSPLPVKYSAVPWDDRASPGPAHTDVSGLRDVAAIGVAFAVLDAKSRAVLNDLQLKTLASSMKDFDPTKPAGDLIQSWQTTVDGSSLPRVAASAVRLYSREFVIIRPQ